MLSFSRSGVTVFFYSFQPKVFLKIDFGLSCVHWTVAGVGNERKRGMRSGE